MKKYATLKDEITKALATDATKQAFFNDLRKIIKNESIIFNALSENELMHLLMYRELAKALNNKKYTLVHDSDFAKSKAKTVHTEIYSYIDSANKRVLHLYASASKISISLDSDTETLAKIVIAKQLKNAYEIRYKNDTKKNTVKDAYIASVAFDDMLNACKYALLILESTQDDLQAMLDKQQAQ